MNSIQRATLTIAVISATVSGCRFGNHVEGVGPADGWSGQYELELQSHKRCVALDGNQGGLCQADEVDSIPSDIAAIFANPTTFQFIGGTEAYFISTSQPTKGYPTHFNTSTAEIADSRTLDQDVPLWTAGECTWSFDTIQKGKINKTQKSGILGRVELDFTLQYTFRGTDCELVLDTMAKCIQSVLNCEPFDQSNTQQALQDYALGWFSRSLELDLVSMDEIKKIRALGSILSYR